LNQVGLLRNVAFELLLCDFGFLLAVRLIVFGDDAQVGKEVFFENVKGHTVGGHVRSLHLFVIEHVKHLARQLSVL
jgi:hypothetical protein